MKTRAAVAYEAGKPLVIEEVDLEGPKAGEVLVEKVLTNRGGPARPLTDAELATKFRDNVTGRLDDTAADTVQRAALDLRHAPDLTTLLSPLNKEFPA